MKDTDGGGVDVKVEITRPPVYVAGEYVKWSREISQTPFPYTKTSVAELIVDSMRSFKNHEQQNNGLNAVESKGGDGGGGDLRLESTFGVLLLCKS